MVTRRSVNFFVERRESLTGDEQVDWVKIPIGFIDVIPFGSPDGYFNADGNRESDWIVFMDYEDEDGNPWPSWALNLNLHPNDPALIYNEPMPGDTAFIIVEKPFLPEDVYEFITLSPFIDNVDARNNLDNIKVVPLIMQLMPLKVKILLHQVEVQEKFSSEIYLRIVQ